MNRGKYILARLILVFCLLGGVLFFMGIKGSIQLLTGGADDTDKISFSDYKSGRLVKGTIYSVLDPIASESEDSSNSDYYLVCIGTETDNYYTLFKTSDKNLVANLETLCKETWDYNDGKSDKIPTPIEFTGKMEKTDDKIAGWRDEYIEKYFSEDEKAEAQKNTLSLTIKDYNYGTSTIITTVAGFFVMIIFAVIAFVLFVLRKGR